MAYSANYWQPVHVPGAGEPEASPPPSRDGRTNSSASSLKRLGTSFSWKSWRKALKPTTDVVKTPQLLPGAYHYHQSRSPTAQPPLTPD